MLGLLTEHPYGQLQETLEENIPLFEQLGAVAIDWRDDGLRGKAHIAGEELLISVQGASI